MTYEYHARILKVTDGDTLRMDVDIGFGMWRRNEPYRLLRINAPEMKFKAGKAARDFLIALLAEVGMDATIRTEKSDVYGRFLAEVELSDGTNLSDYMVEHKQAKFKEYA